MSDADFENEVLHEGQYLYTTIEFTHPDPECRSARHVSIRLQMDYDELVAGASIDVSPSRKKLEVTA